MDMDRIELDEDDEPDHEEGDEEKKPAHVVGLIWILFQYPNSLIALPVPATKINGDGTSGEGNPSCYCAPNDCQ